MRAFDYVITLFAFVYALATAHLLTTVAELIRERARVRFSWVHAAWMSVGLFEILAWWIGMWDMRALPSWSVPMIAFLFVMATLIYLQVRLTCPNIPAEGEIDLREFHRRNGREYIGVFALVALLTVGVNVLFGEMTSVREMILQNLAVVPMFAIAIIATISFRPTVQALSAAAQVALWIFYFATLQGALT
ncbi:MAG TPA: hypothetical protein VHE09_12245 [Rhizomicrobium sp.]|jgi:hypothetical protein|nr:hypothetical protein [Rhizomicrobium sp.]